MNTEVKPKKFRVSAEDKEINLMQYLADTYLVQIAGTTHDEGFILGETFNNELNGMVLYDKAMTYADRDEVWSQGLVNWDIKTNGADKYFKDKRYGFTQLIAYLESVSIKTARNKARLYLEQQINPQLNVQKPTAALVQEVLDLPWFFDDKGNLQKRYENLELVLIKENISVRYNEMTKRYEFQGINHSRDMADATFTMLRSVALDNGLKLNKDDMYSFIQVIANKNRFNPITEYLLNCKEQTKKGDCEEIAKMLNTIVFNNVDMDRVKFCHNLLIKWFCNCIHIAFNTLNDQRTLEFVPCFQGKQGKGKSKWVRRLTPQGYFKGDVILDLDNKDTIAEVLAHWIVELGELGGTFSKSHRDKIKAFITSYQDSWRNPYGHSTNTYPRRTGFFATVNDNEFLVDKTGNRRFFVIPAAELDYNHDVDIDKFWGEIFHLYEEFLEKGTPLYMTAEEQELNDIYNTQYTTKTDTELALDDLFDWDSETWGACKLTDIEKYAREQTGRNYSTNAIKQVLLQHNCICARMTAGEKGKRKQDRYWKVPFVEGVTLPF